MTIKKRKITFKFIQPTFRGGSEELNFQVLPFQPFRFVCILVLCLCILCFRPLALDSEVN